MSWQMCLRPVPEVEGLYADIQGNIWTYWYTRPLGFEKALKKMKPKSRGKYLQVSPTRNAKDLTLYVHRLVCSAFHGPSPPGKPHTRHLDGNASNNVPGNLVWGTTKENGEDKAKHGTAKGSKNAFSKLTEDDVRAIRKLRYTHSMSYVMETYKVSEGCIRKIYNRQSWAHLEDV